MFSRGSLRSRMPQAFHPSTILICNNCSCYRSNVLETYSYHCLCSSNAFTNCFLICCNRPDQVDQPKEPRPRRVLALCCAYRLRFPALFFGATTGLENEQDLHDFVHCAAYSGVFNSWFASLRVEINERLVNAKYEQFNYIQLHQHF